MLLTQCESREDAIYNGRPYELAGPPVQIYHPVFAKFIREIYRPVKAGDLTDEELEGAVAFMHASLDFYEDESGRQDSLNKVKEALGEFATPRMRIDARPILPDGTTYVLCQSTKEFATVCITELGNEIGEGGFDPMMEAEREFVWTCSSEMVIALASRYASPR